MCTFSATTEAGNRYQRSVERDELEGEIEAAYVGGKQKWETIGPSRREAERALTARKREVDTNRARSLRHRPLGTGRRRPERRDARRPRPRLERAGGFLRDTEGLRVDPRRS
jgi:hypothetical protein